MLIDASEQSETKINQFFVNKLPYAQLTIDRHESRFYSVPASKIQLADLFVLLENDQNGDNGFNYFTCSTSSLERVFMEIVRISELQDIQQNSNDGNQQAQIDIFTNSNNQPNTDKIHLNIQNHKRNIDNSANDAP